MGFTAFEIKLDNYYQSYFAGQIVSGQIIIGLNRMKKVKGVKLKLIGKAKTHWKENRGKSSTTISESEYYIDEKIYLFGYDESNTEVFLPQGWNEYPFWFQLPPNLPSSYEMKHGYVKYYLEVIISRESTFKFDHKLTKLFTVNALLDLNQNVTSSNSPGRSILNPSSSAATTDNENPSSSTGVQLVDVWNAKHQISLSDEKFTCCFCCTSGPISFHLSLPKTGYVPGEVINFRVALNNYSTRNINDVTLSLVQSSTFYAKKKTKRVSNEIVTINGPKLEAGLGDVVWEQGGSGSGSGGSTGGTDGGGGGGGGLVIPSVPPTNLGGGCNIITVQYFVKLEIDIPGGVSLKGKAPVLIGTIPLRSIETGTGQESSEPTTIYADKKISRVIIQEPVSGSGAETTTIATTVGRAYNSPNRPSASAQLHLEIHSDLNATGGGGGRGSGNQLPIAGYPNLPPPSYEEAVFCYSAKQRAEDGLDEEEEEEFDREGDEGGQVRRPHDNGDDDDEDNAGGPPDYKNIKPESTPPKTSINDNEGNRVTKEDGPSSQNATTGPRSNTNTSSNYFVPKYVTYKHLGTNVK